MYSIILQITVQDIPILNIILFEYLFSQKRRYDIQIDRIYCITFTPFYNCCCLAGGCISLWDRDTFTEVARRKFKLYRSQMRCWSYGGQCGGVMLQEKHDLTVVPILHTHHNGVEHMLDTATINTAAIESTDHNMGEYSAIMKWYCIFLTLSFINCFSKF